VAADRQTDGAEDEIRAAERAIEWPEATDAGLIFIGRNTRRGPRGWTVLVRVATTVPRVALRRSQHGRRRWNITEYERLEVLYWLHRSRRDLVLQSPRDDGATRPTFALRSPVRLNSIGTSILKLIGLEGATLLVRGLDCLDVDYPLLRRLRRAGKLRSSVSTCPLADSRGVPYQVKSENQAGVMRSSARRRSARSSLRGAEVPRHRSPCQSQSAREQTQSL
jgi:tRNA (adenine37-N6)-methyltransferase